jgi:uncharacterized protein (DUF302 family)
MPTATGYALKRTTPLPFDEAVERVRAELASEGFGIPAEIDVQTLLNANIGCDREPYLILGACMPRLADDALNVEPDLGTLLPCNIVVYRAGGETHISAIDPERMLSIVNNDDLTPIASRVRQNLQAAIERAAASSAS